MMGGLAELRQSIRPMLDVTSPMDALYVYYALYHDPDRTQLAVHTGEAGKADGFVAVCQTGQSLFEPTVVLRTVDATAVSELLGRALTRGRPYYVITTLDLRNEVRAVLSVGQEERNHTYGLDMARFRPTINVLVVQEEGPDSGPRFVIRRGDALIAHSGVNWASPYFAEVFVQTEPAARERGWGKAVVQACTSWVLRNGRKPLYVVTNTNQASAALAKSVGYVDTGVREFAVSGSYRA